MMDLSCTGEVILPFRVTKTDEASLALPCSIK